MDCLSLEYIAGFIDGEGCFTILNVGHDCYAPNFCIVNTNLQLLQRIQKFLSHNLKIYTRHPKNPNWKICYQVYTDNIDDCKSIARLLEPYLMIKKKQAQIIMQYPRARHINIGGVPQKDMATKSLQQKLRNRIRRLNKLGPPNQEVKA